MPSAAATTPPLGCPAILIMALSPPPGEGTRPTSPAKPPSCRPGALTRRPHLVHNENCWKRPGLKRRERVLAGGGALIRAQFAVPKRLRGLWVLRFHPIGEVLMISRGCNV